MNERNPLAVVLTGVIKAVKCVLMVFVWCIIILCVLTKNR